MTKKTKRVFFYSAVAVFLLLSYIVILYAQGYKYSFSENKFQRTGAITLKVNADSRIFLNDKLEGTTSFFSNSYSLDRLLPGKYKLTVQKDDYASWSKTVVVEEGLVTDFPNILLLPEEGEEEQKLFDEVDLLFKSIEPSPTPKPTNDPKPSSTPNAIKEPFSVDIKTKILYSNTDGQVKEMAKDVKGFRLSENKNKLTWWTNNEIWVLWLNDQNYQPFYKKDDKELITRFAQSIQNVAWFRGEDHLIVELEARDSKNRPYSSYKITEIDKRGGLNIAEL